MGFLDNSGDIILDAVLTDTGRMRLAKGDGSFKIAKFALSDDEIDYSLYNKEHASGSAYYDLEIMQTPVLEAFTNNTSTMKHKLVSIARTNLLYLPVVELNEVFSTATKTEPGLGVHLIAVDKETEDLAVTLYTAASGSTIGVMNGENTGAGSYIRVDQGLDTTEIPATFTIDPDLVETQYIVEIDNRFGNLVSVDSNTPANVSYIDDDNVASYYFSLGTDTEYVTENSETQDLTTQVISGPRGTILQFKIRASLELNTSTYLFEQLGSSAVAWGGGGNTERHIDTNIRIMGATTGYTIDVPVRFIKKIS
jgi:hypothetical protein